MSCVICCFSKLTIRRGRRHFFEVQLLKGPPEILPIRISADRLF
jgi:hypothetical protein